MQKSSIINIQIYHFTHFFKLTISYSSQSVSEWFNHNVRCEIWDSRGLLVGSYIQKCVLLPFLAVNRKITAQVHFLRNVDLHHSLGSQGKIAGSGLAHGGNSRRGWDEKELLSWVLCCEWGNLFRQHQHMGVREALPDHRPALIPSSFPKEVWEAGRGRKHSKPLEEGLPEWILALVLDERLSSGEEMQMKDSVFSYDTE